MQQQTKQRVTLIHVLAERWDMQKKGITQHLRHPSFFTSWEEFVLREDPVSATNKHGPHAGWVRCSWRVVDLLMIMVSISVS